MPIGVSAGHTLRQGDLRQALPLLERAMSLCEEADLPFHFSLLALDLAAAYVLGGRVDAAVRLLERALEQATASSTMPIRMLQLFTLGEAHLHAGRLQEAHTLATQTLEYFHAHQERSREAYALRLLGDIAARREPPECDQAGDYYRQALTLAEELGMRPLVAHCHLGLGKLYATVGRRAEAHAELSVAVELYRIMEMTFWLPQAEAVLAEMEG
jgi:tetratricopeptide (TPR) repeat protein